MPSENDIIVLCPICWKNKIKTPLTLPAMETNQGYAYCEIHGKIFLPETKTLNPQEAS